MLQSSVQYTNAGLAKRLAEAADSFRDGLYHYFVCKTALPFDLHYTAGYEYAGDASTEADGIIADLNSDDYSKFGPYKTASSEESAIEYDSIQLRFMQGNSELYCESLPSDTDAIILSLSAYDKFFQSYYVRLYGIDAANEFRANAVASFTSSPRKSVTHKGAKSTGGGTGGTRLVAGTSELG